MFKLNLIRRFSILFFLSLLLIGAALGLAVSNSMELGIKKRAIGTTSYIVRKNIIKHFKGTDLRSVMTGGDYRAFSSKVEHLSLGPDIKGINIWNKEMVLLWSDDKALVGKKFENNNSLKQSFAGEPVAEIVSSKEMTAKYSNLNNIKRTRLMELYVPVDFKSGGDIDIIVEVYQDVTSLYSEISGHKRAIWSRIAVSFSILFVVLFGIVFNASRKLEAQKKELEEMFIQTVLSMVNALDTKSSWTKGHSKRTEKYAERIAVEMKLNNGEIKDLMIASLLHDIGKIGTYDYLLDKVDTLTEEEFEMIKKHPVEGENILKEILQLKDILPIIRHHHERYDGNGYPDGLKGNEIPLLSRILYVADSYDAMTSERPYRPSFDDDYVRNELVSSSGTQFDPEVVTIFLSLLDNNSIKEIEAQ